jgi:flagellar protein FlbD
LCLSPQITVIQVTRLNGKSFLLNALYIETVESLPDTTITLTNGKKYVVKEKEHDVMERILHFYRSVHVLGVVPKGDEDE